MFLLMVMTFSFLNMWFCLSHYFTDRDIAAMIVEAMFTIIFFIVFLMSWGDDWEE